MLTEKWKMWTLNVCPSRVWMAMTGYNTIQWDIFASKDPMQYYKHVRAPYRIHVDSLEASEPWAIALLLLNVFLINRQWIISKECIILLIFANKRHYVRSTPCPKPVKETAIDGMKDWRHLSSGLQKRTVPIYAIMIPPTRGQSAWGQSLFQEANRPVRTLSVPGALFTVTPLLFVFRLPETRHAGMGPAEAAPLQSSMLMINSTSCTTKQGWKNNYPTPAAWFWSGHADKKTSTTSNIRQKTKARWLFSKRRPLSHNRSSLASSSSERYYDQYRDLLPPHPCVSHFHQACCRPLQQPPFLAHASYDLPTCLHDSARTIGNLAVPVDQF